MQQFHLTREQWNLIDDITAKTLDRFTAEFKVAFKETYLKNEKKKDSDAKAKADVKDQPVFILILHIIYF